LAQESDARLAASLKRTSRALEVITVSLVLLVSPLSFVFSSLFGMAPKAWLSVWQEYVFIFVVLALAIALAGFAAASSYRVRAERILRQIGKG